MRRIKLAVTGFFFLALCISLFADEKLSVSVSSECGTLNGQIQEFVFYTDDNNSLQTLSRLDWDISNIWYFGNTISYSYLNKLLLSICYRLGYEQASGIMQDSDWQDEDRPGFKTNYSVHDNSLTSYSEFAMNLGWKFTAPFHVSFTPLLSYEFEDYAFLGSDGYFDYTNDIYDGRKGTFTGPVIGYRQVYSTFKAGLNIQTENLNYFEAGISGFFTPLFYLDGFDDHLIRTPAKHWWDAMENGIMLQGSGYFNFVFNEHCKLGLCGGIQFIPCMSGKTYQKFGSHWIDINSMGGGARTVWNAGAAFTITL